MPEVEMGELEIVEGGGEVLGYFLLVVAGG